MIFFDDDGRHEKKKTMMNIPAEIFAHILSFEDQCFSSCRYTALIVSAVVSPREALSHGVYVHSFSHPSCFLRAIELSIAARRYDLVHAIAIASLSRVQGNKTELSVVYKLLAALVDDEKAFTVCLMSSVLHDYIQPEDIITVINRNLPIAVRYRVLMSPARVFDNCVVRMKNNGLVPGAAFGMILSNIIEWGVTRFDPEYVDDYYSAYAIDIVGVVYNSLIYPGEYPISHVSYITTPNDCGRLESVSPTGYLYNNIIYDNSGIINRSVVNTAIIMYRLLNGDSPDKIRRDWTGYMTQIDRLCIEVVSDMDGTYRDAHDMVDRVDNDPGVSALSCHAERGMTKISDCFEKALPYITNRPTG